MMKNTFNIPKLHTRQEVYDYVCNYIQTVAKFQLAEQQEKGEKYIAFVGDDGTRSTLGCLFAADKLKRSENTKTAAHADLHEKVKKLFRKAQGLPKDQKVDMNFLLSIESLGENLYADKECGRDWAIGKKDFCKEARKLAREYGLKPYNFKLEEKIESLWSLKKVNSKESSGKKASWFLSNMHIL